MGGSVKIENTQKVIFKLRVLPSSSANHQQKSICDEFSWHCLLPGWWMTQPFRCKSIFRDASFFMFLPSTAISGLISEELTAL